MPMLHCVLGLTHHETTRIDVCSLVSLNVSLAMGSQGTASDAQLMISIDRLASCFQGTFTE